MPDVTFGEWLPDQNHVMSPGLKEAKFIYPTAAGWRALPSVERSKIAALDAPCRGVFSGRTQSGTDFLLAATATKIFEESSFDWDDKTNIGGDYALTDSDHWEFKGYGNARYATNRTDPIQNSTGPGVVFVDLSADAPFAGTIEVVGEHLVAGDIVGRGVNAGITAEGGVHWSAIGNPTSWPQVGTQAAIDAQSDYQYLQGNFGRVVQIVDAANYTAIFRERQTLRMDYVGAPKFFDFKRIDNKRGMVAPNTGVAVGDFVYYLSGDGFMVFNGVNTASIGAEKVDRSVLTSMDWNRAAADCSVDHIPSLKSVVWSLPMKSGPIIGWNANVLLGYRYDLQQFWLAPQVNQRVFATIPTTADLSLDGPVYGALDMDDPAPDLGDTNLDTLGSALDREIVLSFFDGANGIISLSGQGGIPGSLKTGSFEFPGGTRGLVRHIRPVFNGDDVFMVGAVYGRNVAKTATPPSVSGNPMGPSGVIPARSSGRYHYANFIFTGLLEDFQGFSYKASRLGSR